ncbi:LacI family DNA-binding transcriptional regulator [Polynucleobacter sp. IMCC 30228]|uniref:LacI family DNA-binding transcriptional regulator n=1 Tax=Polynucleobacter sp. IMCC 30228 TaxID=2781011 RepID=UPI001F37EE95|nr:LacI family DNA-binding transcriptional regulator [Polynucleobacter sp. IMCC 30228]MCE7527085.1 LacI family transcriptional regulator [Polynucleobacter sp. IMCC 30228]
MKLAKTQNKSKIATLHDVASIAGVSPGTVSRAITRPNLVAPKTLEKILSIVKKLHYFPDPAGRNLRSAKPTVIGAVIPKMGVSAFAQTIADLNDALEAQNITLIVSQPEFSLASSESAAYRLLERGADALILLGEDHKPELFEMLHHRELPYILIWTTKKLKDQPYVSVDQSKAGQLAANHLLELGHRHFAFVGIPLAHNPRAAARLAGVKKQLNQAGVLLAPNAIIEEPHRFSTGRNAVEQIFKNQPNTTAIICTSDYHALGVLRGLYEIGKRVPEEISLVSFNNNDFAAYTTPSITSVDLKQHDVGIHAANLIIKLMHGEQIKSIQIQPQLCVRESSAQVKKGSKK